MSTCLRYGSESFEAVSIIPKGFDHELLFVQCESCQGVVGVIDSHSSDMIRRMLEDIESRISEKLDFSI